MNRFGKYDPTDTIQTSTLFTYGEVPLASHKLNTWNANIESALNGVVQCVVILVNGQNRNCILHEGTGKELLVEALNPPSLAVQIHPGKAIAGGYFAGTGVIARFPSSGSIQPPASLPRWDQIYLNSKGCIGIQEGVPAMEPVPPQAPANTLPLACLYLRPGSASIQNEDDGVNGYLVDNRPDYLDSLIRHSNTDASPTETPDGQRRHFSTAARFMPDTLDVYVNGLLQQRVGVYLEDGDRQGYTFLEAPPAGYHLQHRYIIQSS